MNPSVSNSSDVEDYLILMPPSPSEYTRSDKPVFSVSCKEMFFGIRTFADYFRTSITKPLLLMGDPIAVSWMEQIESLQMVFCRNAR